MTTLKEVMSKLERLAPLNLQESYDNSGLITGKSNDEVKNILVCLDCTEAVLDEAIKKQCNMVISHHPILFTGLKSLTGSNYVERTLIKAIKNNIAIYAMHTNLDSVEGGVNTKIAQKLNLQNVSILKPLKDNLKKVVTFVPIEQSEKVRHAMFEAGSGHIGNYDFCSFNSEGYGTFRGGEDTNPFAGKKNIENHEPEIRIESIFHTYDEKNVVSAMLEAHPYEEPAYDVYSLDNTDKHTGIGVTGELSEALSLEDFLGRVKKTFNCGTIKHTSDTGNKITKVALCGGSGSFLINNAITCGADIFVTSDIKYHQFFDADDKIILADIGHYESEQFTVNVIGDFLKENFNTFATYFSSVNTNPIKYF